MKSTLALCIVVFSVIMQTNAFPYGDFTSQLWTVARSKDIDVETFASKTVLEICKTFIPNKPFEALRKTLYITITPSLESLFQRKSLANIYKSFKGFSNTNQGPTIYNMTLLQFMTSASSFDSLFYSSTVIASLSAMTGNASIAPYLNTTDPELLQRNYLSSLYPLLFANIGKILKGTRESFFNNSIRMPEKYYRLIAKNDVAVDGMLNARRKMAIATVRGATKEIQSAAMEFQEYATNASKMLLDIASKSMSLQGMRLIETEKRCNISQNELKTKTLMQMALICIGLPEDFPLLHSIPQEGFPKEAYTSRLIDMAKKMNISFNTLLQFTTDLVIARYMQSKNKVSYQNEPLYYVVKQKGLYIVDLQNKTLYELAKQLSGLDGETLNADLNTTVAVISEMKNETLRTLPALVKKALSIDYPQQHFYFLSLSSIMTLLNSENNNYLRDLASQEVSVAVDESSNEVVARILGMTKVQLKRTPLMALVSTITGHDEKTISNNLRLTPVQIATLKKLDLSTAEEFNRIFSAGDLMLNRQSLYMIGQNHLYAILLVPIKQLLSATGGSLDASLFQLASKNVMFAQLISITASKMGVKDVLMKTLSLNELRFAFNKSPEDMRNQTLFAVLKDLRELSKTKISPDFDTTVWKLSVNKGIELKSLDGKSLLDVIKSVTRSAWQVPLVLKTMKGNPALKMALKNTSKELHALLGSVVEEYKSYNYTINRLLRVLVGLDDVAHTENTLRQLKRFLTISLGIQSITSLGIDMKVLGSKPFVRFGLSALTKSLQNLKKDVYVQQYFKNKHYISPEMLQLLKSKTDDDVGEKLAKAATDWVTINHCSSTNILFHLDELAKNFSERFTQKPLKDIMVACGKTKERFVRSSVRELFQNCLNISSITDIKRSLNVSTLMKPFSQEMPLKEMGRILDVHTDQLDKSLRSFINEKNQKDFGALFKPLKDVFKSGSIDMKTGKNMTLLALFKNPLFAKFNIMGYLLRSMIIGHNLKIIKERSIDDLVKVTGINDEDLSKTTPYDVLKKSVMLLKTDPDVCSKLNRMPNLCHKYASCVPAGNTFNCRCEGGYDGDGFTDCIDKCKNFVCKEGTACVTLPGKGAVCNCIDRWAKEKNGKCQRMKGHMIKVAKLKLKQKYKKEYADTNSIEFKKKASEIEDVLFNSMCKRIGCFAVVVTSIKQGSLVVDFNVVFSSTNVSASVVQDAVDVAVKSPQMAALHPDVTSKPQASRSDACQSGMANCGPNEDCNPTKNGFTCSCASGYKRKGDECKKSGGLSFIVIIIIIIVAFVIIVSLIAFAIWRWKRSRASSSSKYTMAYLTNNETDTVLLTSGEYAFSYGGGKDGAPKQDHGDGEPA